MRIAYLTPSYPPMISGAAISARQNAEAMAGRGHHVLVIAASERDHPYHSYRDGLTVLRLRSIKNPLRVGQRFLAFPRRAALKALDRFHPDVIHVHEPFQLGSIALIYARQNRIPIIFTAHAIPCFVASYFPKPLQPLIERVLWMYARWVLGRYSSVIAPTKTIADIVRRMTGLKPKVISNGIDLQRFHPPLSPDERSAPRRKWDLPSGVPLLLHTGRLDPDKSVDQLLRAAAPALRESEAHLVIVGDGCQKQRLLQLCRELGIEPRVHFLGFISVEEGLPEIYRMADIFLTTSQIETQGLVLLEAAASGLPIVAVNATCIPEIAREGVNGFLAEPGDTDTFSKAITCLLNHSELLHVMSTDGRAIAAAHDIQNTYTLHENLYCDAVKQGSKRHRLEKRRSFIYWKVRRSLPGIK